MTQEKDIRFETQGQILFSRKAPVYLALGSLGSFVVIETFLGAVCWGFGVAPQAIATLAAACILAFGGNLFIWKALQNHKIWVTDKDLVLSPHHFAGKRRQIPLPFIEEAKVILQKMRGQEARIVSLKIRDQSAPLRFLVHDPEGLVSILSQFSLKAA